MLKKINLYSFLMLLVFSQLGSASTEFDQQWQKFCKKMQACVNAQIDAEDMPEQFKEMARQSSAHLCDATQERFVNSQGVENKVVEQSIACIKSLQKLSCDEMIAGDAETPECITYQESIDNL